MDGTMNLEQALQARLDLIACSPADIRAFLRAHPPDTRLVQVCDVECVGRVFFVCVAAVGAYKKTTLSTATLLPRHHPKTRTTQHNDNTHTQQKPKNNQKGAKRLIEALTARGVAVYLISGGFRELTLPIARALGVPPERVFANRMNWQVSSRRVGGRAMGGCLCDD
jgi:hypothetical protein